MKITEVQIAELKTGSLYSQNHENICHKKTLPVLTVAQALEGSYDFAVGTDALQNTGEGGFFIAPAKKPQTIVHHENPHSHRMRARWVFFTMRINESFTEEDFYHFPPILPKERTAEMNDAFDRLFSSEDVFDRYRSAYEIAKILTESAIRKKSVKTSILNGVLDCIETHYAEKITVEQLAALANLSVPRFHAVFKQTMGVSPIAYLNNFRLSAAASLLVRTDAPIGEIALRVGFSDGIYFNKLFRKAYQTAPKLYRKIHRE